MDTEAYLLEATPDSVRFPKPALCRESFRKLTEVCAGLGGFSMGAKPLGISTNVQVDVNQLACASLQCNGLPVLQGDITCPHTQQEVHRRVAQDPGSLTAGFPCQPFSVQGCGLGLRDCRGSVLAAVLKLAWRLQPASVVLECVAAVSEHLDAIGLIRQFASHAGFQIQEVHLELSSQWPARRTRWWCVMLPCQSGDKRRKKHLSGRPWN